MRQNPPILIYIYYFLLFCSPLKHYFFHHGSKVGVFQLYNFLHILKWPFCVRRSPPFSPIYVSLLYYQPGIMNSNFISCVIIYYCLYFGAQISHFTCKIFCVFCKRQSVLLKEHQYHYNKE